MYKLFLRGILFQHKNFVVIVLQYREVQGLYSLQNS